MYRLLVIALILFNISCSDDDGDVCRNEIIETTSLENEYNCENTKSNLEIDLSDDFIVITNQTDFENLVSGNCDPNIDFSRFDLIIGKEQLPSGNDSIDYKYSRNCNTNDYILEVTFNQNMLLIAPNITYHQLVPKIEQGFNVEVEIDFGE